MNGKKLTSAKRVNVICAFWRLERELSPLWEKDNGLFSLSSAIQYANMLAEVLKEEEGPSKDGPQLVRVKRRSRG